MHVLGDRTDLVVGETAERFGDELEIGSFRLYVIRP